MLNVLALIGLVPSTFAISSSPPHLTNFTCGDNKATPLAKLDAPLKAAAKTLNYTDTTWTQTGGNPIEHLSWKGLSFEQQKAATALGYPSECWDCKVDKYEGFYWNEVPDQIKHYWRTLGWNKTNWEEGGKEPASEDKSFYQLTPDEKDAATNLCYDRDSWDNWIAGP
jgi:hypothetical protein